MWVSLQGMEQFLSFSEGLCLGLQHAPDQFGHQARQALSPQIQDLAWSAKGSAAWKCLIDALAKVVLQQKKLSASDQKLLAPSEEDDQPLCLQQQSMCDR